DCPMESRAGSETGAPFRGTRRAPVLGTLSLRERVGVRVNAAWRFKATLLQTAKPTWKPPIRSSRSAPAATSSLWLLARLAFPCVLLILVPFFAQAAEADLILHGGKVVTVDERFSIQEGIAVEGECIVQIGRSAEVLQRRGPRTEVVDLQGRLVLPGLMDSHAHPADAC